jgi:hypothetical protein
MKSAIKNTLRRIGFYLLDGRLPHVPDPRWSPSVKATLATLMLDLQFKARSGQPFPKLSDSGFRIFSQFEEDGLLVYLAAVLELEPKVFIDIGSSDGINSNCANLAVNLGWHGLFIDGSEPAIKRGRDFYAGHADTLLYPPIFKHEFITAENINDLISKAGFRGNIGICSIDIDGNDCWVWNALSVVKPTVVVIETHIELGDRNIAVPYRADYHYPPAKHPEYFGASAPAMVSLATKKGYRLVGSNRYGFNLIFVRNDVFPERVPAVALEDILRHPRHFERLRLAEAVQNYDFVAL